MIIGLLHFKFVKAWLWRSITLEIKQRKNRPPSPFFESINFFLINISLWNETSHPGNSLWPFWDGENVTLSLKGCKGDLQRLGISWVTNWITWTPFPFPWQDPITIFSLPQTHGLQSQAAKVWVSRAAGVRSSCPLNSTFSTKKTLWFFTTKNHRYPLTRGGNCPSKGTSTLEYLRAFNLTGSIKPWICLLVGWWFTIAEGKKSPTKQTQETETGIHFTLDTTPFFCI